MLIKNDKFAEIPVKAGAKEEIGVFGLPLVSGRLFYTLNGVDRRIAKWF